MGLFNIYLYNFFMERKVGFAPGEYFHIYNRGVDKRDIFLDQSDYKRFLESLYLFNSSNSLVIRDISKNNRFSYEIGHTIVDIGAYCLMPNHFHLLVRSKDDSSISLFMKKLLTGYSMYFNKKYNRNGVLFQGVFRSQHVSRDEYLKYLFSYIHLNPVKIIDPEWKDEGIKDLKATKNYLANYVFSSYQDYFSSGRVEASILNKEAFPEYFKNSKDFDEFIEFWLSFKNTTEDSPLW